jgi:hypothetical protein
LQPGATHVTATISKARNKRVNAEPVTYFAQGGAEMLSGFRALQPKEIS